jgi:Adenosylmethionine decarboxylase
MAPDINENTLHHLTGDESSDEGGEIPTEIIHEANLASDNVITLDSNNNNGNNVNNCPAVYDEAQPQAAPHDLFFADDDNQSGELREYNGYFEGPEKTLEVCFRKKDSFGPPSISPSNDTRHTGLRCLSRHDLDRICARARCTILSQISNNYVDAYVLSESSLFVYPYMLVLKTCGTTTLLRCIALLIEMGKRLGLEIDWVGYSRKNFNFPGDQAFPHQSFHQELEYLYSHRNVSVI